MSIVLVTFENWQFSKSSTIAKTLKFYQNVRQALRIVVANVGIIFEKCVVTGGFSSYFSFRKACNRWFDTREYQLKHLCIR